MMNAPVPFDPATYPRAFRDALGAFATGVTIVTCNSSDGPVGITANSFASVSLDPALVLWSPAKSSKRFAEFNAADRFAIHVLGADQRNCCDGFTRDKGSFGDLDWSTDAHGTPLIEGCLARFNCTRHAVHEGGDHVIIVGHVHEAESRSGAPLLFHGGRFLDLT
ncbi:putative flavin reductase like domain protein [Thalassobium sp. R2A62]|jgi:flavin reductase (DIM6/NTAB) family NADH-FMN oxidoreductase RutF|nr:putative flavin reductase like domain protein [Thalassobium sp. R2A62]